MAMLNNQRVKVKIMEKNTVRPFYRENPPDFPSALDLSSPLWVSSQNPAEKTAGPSGDHRKITKKYGKRMGEHTKSKRDHSNGKCNPLQIET
jgi:hypothetical protein